MAALFDRDALIHRLCAGLERLDGVHAAWLEGADAEGRADQYSDIDLWFDVDQDRVEEAYEVIQQGLLDYGPLDLADVTEHPHPQIRQRFYRSAGLPHFCFVDACAQLHGREVVFGPGDAVQVLFDRGGVLRMGEVAALDVLVRARQLSRRRWRWVLVEKALCRGHTLEALAYYHSEVLAPLVELLRLRFHPEKHAFGLKHVHHDLPVEVLGRLEDLYARTDAQAIEEGLELAGQWFEGQLRAFG